MAEDSPVTLRIALLPSSVIHPDDLNAMSRSNAWQKPVRRVFRKLQGKQKCVRVEFVLGLTIGGFLLGFGLSIIGWKNLRDLMNDHTCCRADGSSGLIQLKQRIEVLEFGAGIFG